METAVQSKPHFSIPSLLAITAAIGSFFVSAGLGFILAMVAIGFGVIGFFVALAPSVRGGFISILSLMLACVGIVIAIIKAVI